MNVEMENNEDSMTWAMSCPHCNRPFHPTEIAIDPNGNRMIAHPQINVYFLAFICHRCGNEVQWHAALPLVQRLDFRQRYSLSWWDKIEDMGEIEKDEIIDFASYLSQNGWFKTMVREIADNEN